jgi:hypothetical protein
MRLSNLSASRIVEKIDSCKAVGVTKTTYSSICLFSLDHHKNRILTFRWKVVLKNGGLSSQNKALADS